MTFGVEFNKHDFWIGLYWRYDKTYGLLYIYICLIPCIPILITFDRVRQEAKKLSKIIQKVRE